ncbi:MAG TPA: quinolinate synthase NadA [Actinomycetota bacterium]
MTLTTAPADTAAHAADISAYEPWAEEVRRLARERDAVILAHNYQVPWIQDVADFVGDSLELSRKAAAAEAREIVFCGVHFMAETAAILSPDKRVLIPDLEAGCSLSDTITAEQLREWKAGHPGAVVVAYVNTTAEVKAESDICCTSQNAAAVVASIPEDREILFLPDMFLGAHVERVTGRKMQIWMGECHVHAGIGAQELKDLVRREPDAELLIHPECGCASAALYLAGEGELPAERTQILSTGGMMRHAQQASGGKFIVATETGILHRLRKENPAGDYLAANEAAVCRYMKTITPAKLTRSLRDGVHEVRIEPEIADRARAAIQRMIEIG